MPRTKTPSFIAEFSARTTTADEAVLDKRPHDWPASLLLERCKQLQQSGVDEEWSPVEALRTK